MRICLGSDAIVWRRRVELMFARVDDIILMRSRSDLLELVWGTRPDRITPKSIATRPPNSMTVYG